MSQDNAPRISSESKRKDYLIHLENCGNKALSEKNSEDLQKTANEILKIDSLNAQAHYWLGIASEAHEDEDAIIENHYRNSVISNPKFWQSYVKLGEIASKTPTRIYEAKDYLRRALELAPQHFYVYYAMGNILAKEKSQDKEAEKYFRESLNLYPSYSITHSSFGWLLLKYKSRQKECKDFFENAIALDSANAHAYQGLAHFYESVDIDFKKSELNYKKALELQSEDADCLLRLGFLYQKFCKYYEAIEVCQRVAIMKESDFVSLLVISSCYRDLGFEDESKKYLNLAGIIVNRENFILLEKDYYNFACLQSLFSNTNEALKYLTLALQDSEELKITAATDSDFDLIRNHPNFISLIS